MVRLVRVGCFAAVALTGAAIAVACGSDYGDAETGTDGGPGEGGAASVDAPSNGPTSSDAGDAGDGEAGGPPVLVLSTPDSVLDIDVLGGTLYLLRGAPSSVASCSAASCPTPTELVPATSMPPELARAESAESPFYFNARILLLPPAATPTVLVAQTGNAPCSACPAEGSPYPGIFAVSSTNAPSELVKMTPALPNKATNSGEVVGTRGATLWYTNLRNNEDFTITALNVVTFAADASILSTRVDTRTPIPGPGGHAYVGTELAGAHRGGPAYITQSVAGATSTPLDEINELGDASSDTATQIATATFLGTTASFVYTRDALLTDPAQLRKWAKGGTGAPTNFTLPGATAATTLLPTELGLMWFTPPPLAPDGGPGTGPIAVSFCVDTDLAAVTCTPVTYSLDLDAIVRVRDEAPYLYILGSHAGNSVVLRFEP